MDVRVEQPGDVAAVAEVHRGAFPTPEGTAEPVEVGLVQALRADAGWIPGLSLVAVEDGEVVVYLRLPQKGELGLELGFGVWGGVGWFFWR